MKILPLGPVTTTTLSTREMLVLSLSLLADLSPKIAARLKSKKVVARVEGGEELSQKHIHAIYKLTKRIIAEINKHVPPFCYFGYHPSDHEQLGVWIDLDALHKGEVSGKLAQVSSASWKGVKSTYVLDTANAGLVLYRRKGKKEVWRVE